ncbi:Hexokinase [Exophiala dermatitidis]|uniref:Phosphotransferase n=1 Tax=Exophiala dermatitidis (strain ATCC 34100 / CBS 525.76 / NIH/UT8656) TaxID=858893 RepID=H6BVT9_EXODN|nr:hexokinase [Exophiala dermatitidis NIH/UT8656]EHY55093.1 hexokinase [Exophiala dermatitidis NIH/UT8656]
MSIYRCHKMASSQTTRQNGDYYQENYEVEPAVGEELPSELQQELARMEKLFTVDTAMLKKVTKRFGEELQQGLEKDFQNIPMNLTWVTSWPTGEEKGTFLTLDLGGTNLRVCLITLGKRGEPDLVQEKYKLPESIKTGSADELFDTMATSLQEFLDNNPEQAQKWSKDSPLPLGFTFSYPATQERIDHGILQTWTKGWDVKDVEGKDVAELLTKAIQKRNLPIKLVALVNDTTGALIASAYNDPETIVGAIFGTGCNAAYMEKRKDIPKLARYSQSSTMKSKPSSNQDSQTNDADDEGTMAINCEYGAFDNSHSVLPRTKYDEIIDEESPRPGEQTFEKMSAGLYLGEIFRLVLVDLRDRGVVLQDKTASGGGALTRSDAEGDRKGLDEPYALDTEFLALVENDESPDLVESRKRFEAHLHHAQSKKPISPSREELLFFRRIAQLIAMRGARLCACGVSAICQRLGIDKGHVAADGSVAIKHPHFKSRWEKAVAEILEIEQGRVTLTSAEDGSGIGAAVIAALTLKSHNNAY